MLEQDRGPNFNILMSKINMDPFKHGHCMPSVLLDAKIAWAGEGETRV